MYHQWLLASTEVRLYPLIIGAIKKKLQIYIYSLRNK